ncbi:hypothetical protein H4CHR_04434 [Variovorax sp. PBS-H4]|uniref:hypothetical protein n=1 Tax=Variovorax sp. PBS-H4 TaxID=434008 RepID=UPI0013160114|nr:hypothetical protein [Variovorax sp. PBS-H4]VTU38472.1 hypothetical protein H4CHR_04434 [Variovorax sp. PBS-H4]
MATTTTRRKPAPGRANVKARIRASSISIEYEGSLSEDVALQIYRMLVSGEMNPIAAAPATTIEEGKKS